MLKSLKPESFRPVHGGVDKTGRKTFLLTGFTVLADEKYSLYKNHDWIDILPKMSGIRRNEKVRTGGTAG
nr:MAG: hypothetical protein OI720_00255 [Candidatus Methanoperedens sp.]